MIVEMGGHVYDIGDVRSMVSSVRGCDEIDDVSLLSDGNLQGRCGIWAERKKSRHACDVSSQRGLLSAPMYGGKG